MDSVLTIIIKSPMQSVQEDARHQLLRRAKRVVGFGGAGRRQNLHIRGETLTCKIRNSYYLRLETDIIIHTRRNIPRI